MLIIVLSLTLLLSPASGEAGRLPPDVYPLLYQTMMQRLEPSDFAGLERYDILDLADWSLRSDNGNIDSLRAIRERNPNLVVWILVPCQMTCSNWGNQEIPGKHAWADSLIAHTDEWMLRDVDGDLWLLNNEESYCDEGRLNWTNIDMAEAYAEYVAQSTILSYPDVIDGIRLDDIQRDVRYLNSWIWWFPPHVDSIDTNRDGIADDRQELIHDWSAGTHAFLTRLRELVGPDVLISYNGNLPLESCHLVNGRHREGFPHSHGRGWEVSMTDPLDGYLTGESIYSDYPMEISGLFTLNCTPRYNYDPDILSIKEEPYPHPSLPGFVDFTLASSLMGDGWYAMSGWGTTVDWKGDRIQTSFYQTLWWFDIYDILRTNLGTPTGPAERDTTIIGRDRFSREFTGGRVRVFPQIDRGIFDLRPIPVMKSAPGSVMIGDPVPVDWQVTDPNGDVPLDVSVSISRDGGDTFDEGIGLFDQNDSGFVWIADGPAADECVLKVTATDTTELTGESHTIPFRIEEKRSTFEGRAEIAPNFWIANSPEILCTLSVATADTTGRSSGWNRLMIAMPEGVSFVRLENVSAGEDSLPASAATVDDSVRIDMGEIVTNGGTVHFRVTFSAPSSSSVDSLRFGVSVMDTSLVGEVVDLGPGDTDTDETDCNCLAIICGTGPTVRIAVDPDTTTLSAGDTLRFVASGFDAAENGVDIYPEWSVSGSSGTIDEEGLFLAMYPGSLFVALTASGLVDSAFVRITAGMPDSLFLSPVGGVIPIDSTLMFTVSVFDEYDNPLDTPPVWSVDDTIAVIDPDGSFHPVTIGSTTVRVSVHNLEAAAGVKILPGAPDSLFLSPAGGVIPIDSTLVFTVLVFDEYSNSLDTPPVWSVDDTIAVIDPDGVFHPVTIGSTTVRASVHGLEAVAGVKILPGTPAIVVISPRDPEMMVGDTLRLQTEITDSHGNILETSATWSVTGDAGTIDETGLFTALAKGTEWILADHLSLRDSVRVIVMEEEESPPADFLRALGSEEQYRAELWPSPLSLVIDLVDSLGTVVVAEEPESIYVDLHILDPTLTVYDPDLLSIVGYSNLPDTLSLTMSEFGGRGRLEVSVSGSLHEGYTPDTLHFSSPDLNGDHYVELSDLALSLDDLQNDPGGERSDLNVDGATDSIDLSMIASMYGEGHGTEIPATLFPGEPMHWICPDGKGSDADTSGLRFIMNAGEIDSIRIFEISFPIPRTEGVEVEWIPSVLWRSPVLFELEMLEDEARLLLVERGRPFQPNGEAILEMMIHGVTRDQISTAAPPSFRVVTGDYLVSDLYESPIEFLLSTEENPVDTSEETLVPPSAFAVFPARPNPFRTSAVIRYQVPSPGGDLCIAIYNTRGQRVTTLENGNIPAGDYTAVWDTRDRRGNSIPPGVYFVRMETPSAVLTRKLMLVP